MEFPVDITFGMMGWTASLRITDGAGRLIGFAPQTGDPKGQLRIYADERKLAPIYTIKAEHPFTQWFEDAAGKRFGEYGIVPNEQGKFVSVGGEARFEFVDATPWLDFFDRLIPSVPIANGFTGVFVRPMVLAVRTRGGPNVLRIVKKRGMIDIRYTLHGLNEMDGAEIECLMLSAIIDCRLNMILRR